MSQKENNVTVNFCRGSKGGLITLKWRYRKELFKTTMFKPNLIDILNKKYILEYFENR